MAPSAGVVHGIRATAARRAGRSLCRCHAANRCYELVHELAHSARRPGTAPGSQRLVRGTTGLLPAMCVPVTTHPKTRPRTGSPVFDDTCIH